MSYVSFFGLVFFLFNGILFNYISNTKVLGLWDEGLSIILFCFCLIKILSVQEKKIKINKEAKMLFPWLVLIFSGLTGNFIWEYAGAPQAIIRDIVGFLKFPVCFFAFRFLKLDEIFSKTFRNKFARFLRVIVSVMFIFAIVSLFANIGMSQGEVRHGVHSYQFLFNHPNSLGMVLIMILCLLDSINIKNSQILYIGMCLIMLALTMRTKILAFVAVYIYISFGSRWLKQFKVMFLLGSVLVIGGVSYSKLAVVTTWSEAARMRFWTESFNLLKKCFPIGSGFGTFASHISGKYPSKLYGILKIKEIFDQDGNPTAVLGDTGYPYYIAQFGVLGIVMIFVSVKNLWKIIRLECGKKKSALFLIIYILIALTGEATLLNTGFTLAVVLTILICNNRYYEMEQTNESSC